MLARRIVAFMMVLTQLGWAVACTRQAAEAPPQEIKIVGAGATFPYPLYKQWIQEYRNIRSDVEILYDPVGSGEGVRRFLKQEVDFAASDAAMSDEEMARVERGVRLIPATAGIIVLAYNLKGVRGMLRLPREVYAAIFSGEIKKWDDPRIKQANPGLALPALDLILVTRTESSGTTYAFTNHLSAISQAWRDRGPGVAKLVQWPVNAMSVRGNEGVAGRVKLTEGAIGYVEYGYALRAGLAMAALENKSGKFIEPTPLRGLATLVNTRDDIPANRRLFFPDPPGDDSYPLVTYSWILVYTSYPDEKKAGALKEFVQWGIGDGQMFSESLGFCRLPAPIAELGVRDLGDIRMTGD